MHRSYERSAWRGIAASAAGVIVVSLGAKLLRRWWHRPRPLTSRSPVETPEVAALAVAVGAMADEGAPAESTS